MCCVPRLQQRALAVLHLCCTQPPAGGALDRRETNQQSLSKKHEQAKNLPPATATGTGAPAQAHHNNPGTFMQSGGATLQPSVRLSTAQGQGCVPHTSPLCKCGVPLCGQDAGGKKGGICDGEGGEGRMGDTHRVMGSIDLPTCTSIHKYFQEETLFVSIVQQ